MCPWPPWVYPHARTIRSQAVPSFVRHPAGFSVALQSTRHTLPIVLNRHAELMQAIQDGAAAAFKASCSAGALDFFTGEAFPRLLLLGHVRQELLPDCTSVHKGGQTGPTDNVCSQIGQFTAV